MTTVTLRDERVKTGMYPANIVCGSNTGLLLVRWPDGKSALGQCIVFVR